MWKLVTHSSGRSKVLVVEDEPDISDAVVARLDGEGYETCTAVSGPEAVRIALDELPDLIILDLNLPGFDGIEVCRQVHAVRRIPIIMVTARADETDMLVGLGMGADDYLTKPFSMRELVARIKVVLRRSVPEPNDAEVLAAGRLSMDIGRRTATFAGQPVHFTPTEFDLLRALVEANGAVMRRDALLHKVWGYGDTAGSRTVDSHVRSVRRKTEDEIIRTVHGIGYAATEAPTVPS
ncbi:MAG: response regulator transcription factor [Acidimicrobiales bacterium]|nr:response regulator transcription factor [Acidimicrobiales bacterium]